MAKRRNKTELITARHRRLIRGPGGRFASDEQLIDVYFAKQQFPKKTYAELSKEWIRENKPDYTPPERDTTGEIISREASKEITKAAKQLHISRDQAKALYLENRLVKSEQGYTPLFAVGGDVDAYFERVPGFHIKVKFPGEKKYHTFNNRLSARRAIEQVKREMFAEIKARTGKARIDSDDIPVIRIVDKYRPGKFLPERQLYDFNKTLAMGDLDDDERTDLMDKITSGQFKNNTTGNEAQNNKSNRGNKRKKSNRKAKTK